MREVGKAAKMSLKYLLTALQANKTTSTSIQDVSQLLLEAHTLGKSAKRAEEEWNESLERLLAELRSHPESEPFQKPVPKKVAPDYDKVIAQPMDLSTMGKKIRAKDYKNKKQFARDLHLIWQNCMSYNSAPGHPMQAQALYMKRLGNHFLEHILDRPDVPPLPPSVMPAALQQQHQQQQQSQQSQGVVHLNGDGAAANGNGVVTAGEVEPTQADPGKPQAPAAIVDGIVQGPAPAQIQAALASTSTWTPLKTTLADEEAIIRTQAGMIEWCDVDRDHTVGSALGHSPGRSGKLSLPAWYPPAAVASSSSSSSKSNKKPSHSRSKSADKSKAQATSSEQPVEDADAEARSRAEALASDDDRWWFEASRRDRVAAAVPRLSHKPRSTTRRPTTSQSAINGTSETAKRGRTRQPDDSVSLQRRIGHNITTLARMREASVRLHAKMNGLEADDGEDGPKKLEWEDEGDEGWESRLADLWAADDEEPRLEEGRAAAKANERYAVDALQVACGGLLAHAGFEGSSETAVQTLAVAAGRHLEALGRSFRMHLDGGLGMLTETEPEDIVRLSLAENGTTTQDLESHVVDDIVKHGSKLDEMLRKLKTAYDDYVPDAPVDADDEDVEEDDLLFGGIPGMGDMSDFLGFSDFAGAGAVPKSLLRGRRPAGLPNGDHADPFSASATMANATSSTAKPNGIHPSGSSSSVVRNGIVKKKATTAGGGSRAPPLDYPPPPPLVPLMRIDLPHQIGLLQVFYKEKFDAAASALADQENDDDEPMESDKAAAVNFILDEPCDPSLPPMGNFGQIVVKDAGGTGAGGGAGDTGGGSAAAKRKAAAAAAANGDGTSSAVGANGAAKRSKANRADSGAATSRGGGVFKALDALEAEEDDVGGTA